MSETFTLKRCLALCLPALLLGLWLRASIVLATPEAMLVADTNSYWDCVSRLWNDGKLDIPEKRRWLYPLLLMAAPAFPGNTPQVVALAQHALGLMAIVGVGWIAGNLTRWSVVVVPLATLLFAAAPRGLAYEHQIIADSAMTNFFILAVAVSLPLRGMTQSRLAGSLALCAIVIALKPHGKPLALPILIAAAFCAGLPLRWHWGNWTLALACVALFFSSGSSRQGGWLLLSSSLPFVRESGEPYSHYRAALAPVIAEARALGDAYPWEQYRYKKLLADSDSYEELTAGKAYAEAGAEWNALTRRKDEFRTVTSSLARSAVLAAPVEWMHFTALKTARGLANPEAALLAELEPGAFWEAQRDRNEERWAERAKAIALIYERDRAGYDALVQERSSRAAPDLANFAVRAAASVNWFADDLSARRVTITWIGVVGLIGLAASLRNRAGWPLIAALALSLGSSFGIGDAIPRYVYPVEWMLFLFPLLGAVAVLDAAAFFRKRSRKHSG